MPAQNVHKPTASPWKPRLGTAKATKDRFFVCLIRPTVPLPTHPASGRHVFFLQTSTQRCSIHVKLLSRNNCIPWCIILNPCHCILHATNNRATPSETWNENSKAVGTEKTMERAVPCHLEPARFPMQEGIPKAHSDSTLKFFYSLRFQHSWRQRHYAPPSSSPSSSCSSTHAKYGTTFRNINSQKPVYCLMILLTNQKPIYWLRILLTDGRWAA